MRRGLKIYEISVTIRLIIINWSKPPIKNRISCWIKILKPNNV